MLLAIFDTSLRDPDDGIVISQALVDEDGGAEKYAKYGSGWGESIDEEGIRPFIASFSDLSPKAPKEGGVVPLIAQGQADASIRSEEHTSELQSLMRISYAVFCLKKKNIHTHQQTSH